LLSRYTKQDTDNQRRELEAVAARSGWRVERVYEDAGISGSKGRDKRPGLDAMLKAVNAKEFDMVAAWSVDRLGRSLTDLLSILQGLHDKGVDLFLHQQGLDTSTTAGKAMFQMLGVFAEFERGIIRERVNAGLARARAKGTKLGRRRGPAVRGSTDTRAPGRRHGHPKDRSDGRSRHVRGATRGAELEQRHEQGDLVLMDGLTIENRRSKRLSHASASFLGRRR
jgi:DNA invertase Pin-like site-specific DNA recombinase